MPNFLQHRYIICLLTYVLSMQRFAVKQKYKQRKCKKQDALLSQGEQRDAAISFDTTASCMRLLWYSMGFLYMPTSAQQPFKC